MSDLTKQAVVDALTAHVADEDGATIVTGLLLVAALASIDSGTSEYRFEVLSEDQPAHVTRGLASLVHEWASDVTSLNAWMTDDDD